MEAIKFMQATNSARGIQAMISLARCELPVRPDQLDVDPWAFNCLNGTVDLRTGDIRPHRREDLLTKLCPVEYDRDADCPIWRSVVNRIMAGNEQLIAFLQRMAGYSLCGVVREHVLLFCYGTGSNGKSLFLGTILDCLGTDYAMKAPPDLLMAKRSESHPTERADLAGKRFVACIEAEDGHRLAEGMVKELTGGDRVTSSPDARGFLGICAIPHHLVSGEPKAGHSRCRSWYLAPGEAGSIRGHYPRRRAG